MSEGITFTERHDQNMAGSEGKCGPEFLGDIEAKGRIDQVGNCFNDSRVPIWNGFFTHPMPLIGA
jgi:hypothetical protein